MKQLWIGQLAIGGTITVPELPYYNFLFIVNTSNETGFATRVPGEIFKGIIVSGAENYGQGPGFWTNTVTLVPSGTSLTFRDGIAFSVQRNSTIVNNTNDPANIGRIYGIL